MLHHKEKYKRKRHHIISPHTKGAIGTLFCRAKWPRDIESSLHWYLAWICRDCTQDVHLWIPNFHLWCNVFCWQIIMKIHQEAILLTITYHEDSRLLSGRASYCKISWSLEAKRFRFRLFQSFWNSTGTSALPRCLSNFRAIQSL